MDITAKEIIDCFQGTSDGFLCSSRSWVRTAVIAHRLESSKFMLKGCSLLLVPRENDLWLFIVATQRDNELSRRGIELVRAFIDGLKEAGEFLVEKPDGSSC